MWRSIAILIRYGCASAAAGADQDGGKCHRHLTTVGRQVGDQPTHQPRVVGFSENLVVLQCRFLAA